MRQDQLDPRAREQQQAQNAQVAKLHGEQAINDVRLLMSEAWGRRIMANLLAQAGVYRTSFTGNSETFFREGQRDIGLRYIAIIQAHCADDFLKMLKEQAEHE